MSFWRQIYTYIQSHPETQTDLIKEAMKQAVELLKRVSEWWEQRDVPYPTIAASVPKEPTDESTPLRPDHDAAIHDFLRSMRDGNAAADVNPAHEDRVFAEKVAQLLAHKEAPRLLLPGDWDFDIDSSDLPTEVRFGD